MEAAAEGAVGLSEAREGSPLSGAAASDDADTVVGVSYGMDAADMGTLSLIHFTIPTFHVHLSVTASIFLRGSAFCHCCRDQKVPTHLC